MERAVMLRDLEAGGHGVVRLSNSDLIGYLQSAQMVIRHQAALLAY